VTASLAEATVLETTRLMAFLATRDGIRARAFYEKTVTQL